MRTRQVAELLGGEGDTRVTLAPAGGNDAQNRIYCSKDGSFIEGGTPGGQGKRTDLANAVEVATTKGLDEVAAQYPTVYVRYHRGLDALVARLNKKRRTPEKEQAVLWLHGNSGVGKTRICYELAKRLNWNLYKKNVAHRWWNGYDYQEILLLDDIRCTSLGTGRSFNELLAILDRYPHQVETKGNAVELCSDLIIVTSINHPSVEFQATNDQEPLEQLLRRITSTIQVFDYEQGLNIVLDFVYDHFDLLNASGSE